LIDSKEIAIRALRLAELKSAQRKRRRRKANLIIAASGIVATAAIVAILGVLQPGMKIEDEPIPLASPEMPIFQGIESITIPAGALEMKIPLENPENSSCNVIFELILADTGEVLYISELTPPGGEIGSIILTRFLEKGEYEVLLNIRAYEPNGSNELNVTSKIINLNVD